MGTSGSQSRVGHAWAGGGSSIGASPVVFPVVVGVTVLLPSSLSPPLLLPAPVLLRSVPAGFRQAVREAPSSAQDRDRAGRSTAPG